MTKELNNASHSMITNVPVVLENKTIGDIEKGLLEKIKGLETIQYIYVLDDKNRLTGVVSIKELFRSPKSKPIKEVMTREVHAARPHTDQEHLVRIALKYNIKAVPVTDKENIFLGVVPSDKILEILQYEHTEDVLRGSGVHKFDKEPYAIINASALTHLKKRLPWLIIGLAGGILAAAIVNYFEAIIEKEILLAAFVPAIVYIADASGTQIESLLIRSLAINNSINLRKYITREVVVALMTAIILGLMGWLLTAILWGQAQIALVFGIAIAGAVLSSLILAVSMPLFLRKINIDPAFASGPFATVLQDILSIVIYFLVATAILQTI